MKKIIISYLLFVGSSIAAQDKLSLLQTVQMLIQEGYNIETPEFEKFKNESERTYLMRAACLGDVEATQFLVEHGANVNAQSAYGQTALMLAAYHGNIKIVRLLLEAGANVHTQDQNGLTALMYAVFSGSTDIPQLLLDHGSCKTMQDNKGRTALSMATVIGHAKIIALLKNYGEKEWYEFWK